MAPCFFITIIIIHTKLTLAPWLGMLLESICDHDTAQWSEDRFSSGLVVVRSVCMVIQNAYNHIHRGKLPPTNSTEVHIMYLLPLQDRTPHTQNTHKTLVHVHTNYTHLELFYTHINIHSEAHCLLTAPSLVYACVCVCFCVRVNRRVHSVLLWSTPVGQGASRCRSLGQHQGENAAAPH